MSMCVPSVYPSHGSSRTSLFFQALHSPEVAALPYGFSGDPRHVYHVACHVAADTPSRVTSVLTLVGGKATRSNVVLTAPVAPRVRAHVDAHVRPLCTMATRVHVSLAGDSKRGSHRTSRRLGSLHTRSRRGAKSQLVRRVSANLGGRWLRISPFQFQQSHLTRRRNELSACCIGWR